MSVETPLVPEYFTASGYGYRAVAVFGLLSLLLTALLFRSALGLGNLPAALLVALYYSRRYSVDWRSWLAVRAGPGGWREVWVLGAGAFLVTLALGFLMAMVLRLETLQALEREPLLRLPVPMLFAVTVLLGPVAEELVFRGLLLGSLRPRGDAQAVFASAVIFALLHGPTALQSFIVGLLLAAVVVRTGSLVPAVVLHMAWNAIPSALVACLTYMDGFRGHGSPAVIVVPMAVCVLLLGLTVWAGRGALGRFWAWAKDQLALSPRMAARELAFMARHGSVWFVLVWFAAGMVAFLGLTGPPPASS